MSRFSFIIPSRTGSNIFRTHQFYELLSIDRFFIIKILCQPVQSGLILPEQVLRPFLLFFYESDYFPVNLFCDRF